MDDLYSRSSIDISTFTLLPVACCLLPHKVLAKPQPYVPGYD